MASSAKLNLKDSTERPVAMVEIYKQNLIHDEPSDVLVDLLAELQQHCRRVQWDFSYALKRSRQELKAA